MARKEEGESEGEWRPRENDDPEDQSLDTEAEVTCPYCGETMSITVDPDGGNDQEYVEDCQVCCRPWKVQVQYDDEGKARVWVEGGD